MIPYKSAISHQSDIPRLMRKLPFSHQVNALCIHNPSMGDLELRDGASRVAVLPRVTVTSTSLFQTSDFKARWLPPPCTAEDLPLVDYVCIAHSR